MDTLRLCFIGPCASIVLRRWMDWFAARGHDVTALTVEPAHPTPASFRQVDLTTALGSRKLGRLASSVRLAMLIRQLKPDLVHAHYLRGLAWGLLPVKPSPLVATPWGSDVLEEQGAFREWYGRSLTTAVLHAADLVTVHSAYMERRVRALLPAAASVVRIGWGVDLRQFRPGLETGELRKQWNLGDKTQVILSPRLAQPLYRHDVIIKAFAQVSKKIPGAILAIPEQHAEPDYVTGLRRLAEEQGVAARVRFVGVIPYDEMPRWYNLADAVVMVPRSDGMPSSLWEAMACGAVPVLGHLPQYEEAVKNGENGWLVPPVPEQLAESLVRVLKNPDERRRMADRNKTLVVEQADQDREMGRMEAWYEDLAKRTVGSAVPVRS